MNSVDSAMAELLHLDSHSRLTSKMKDQIRSLLSGLRFLQLYEQCLIKWNEALQGKKNRHLGSVRSPHIKATLEGAARGLYTTGIHALETQNFRDWDASVSNLLERIQRCKPNIKEVCLELLVRSFQIRFSSFELQKFFSSLSDSLDEIIRKEMVADSDIKMQIRGIKEKLQLFAQIFEFSRKIRRSKKDLKDLIILSQSWAYNAACLSLLYWVLLQNQEQDTPIRMRIFLSTPAVTEMFLAVLKYLWSISHDRFLVDEGVPRFVDFLLEILQLIPLKDDVENLRKELILLTTFLINPPMVEDHRNEAESIVNEIQDLFFSLCANKIVGQTTGKKNILLQTFLEKMKIIEVEVRKLYAKIFRDSSSFHFPRINALGFLESLLEKLKAVSFQSANQDVVILKQNLMSIRASFRDRLQFQNQHAEVKDLKALIVNVAYRIEIAINLLSNLKDSVWCNMNWVTKLRDEIELIRSKLWRIKLYNQGVHDREIRSKPMLPLKVETPLMEDVGFVDEVVTVIEKLVSGGSHFAIVSIVGTAGQGKTTLANRVYMHCKIMEHFDVRGWVTVSQACERRALLQGILTCITQHKLRISLMDEEDLADLIYKHLRGRRFLIVLDDIWDINTFNDLKFSFPDDGNGSRILLTSRRELALNFRNGFTLRVRPLSYDESWLLLAKKLFTGGACPPQLIEVGKRVAKICNGLPLAVVLAAGLLSNDPSNLDWWNEIAETLDSRMADESFMGLVEQSYNNLPEHLKQCFLYFGAFQQDKVIRVRKLRQLWVAEGFVHMSDGESPEDVAMEYLRDLVSRSLVAVTKRGSTGGIKECQVGSLFYELCLKKAKEEMFLHVESGEDQFFNSKFAIYKNYRVCVQSGADGFFSSNPSGPCVHSLLFRPDHTCLNKGAIFSLCNFNLLQVLDLEDIELNGFFPEEATLLLLLGYLAIWSPSGILSIPPSISNLRHLETLHVKTQVRSGDEIRLPDTFWTMKRLRHVNVGGFTASFSFDSEPDEESLALANIQSFSAPSLCFGEDAEKLLRRIAGVRKLRCRFHDSGDCFMKQNCFPILDILSRIESLNVQYTGSLLYPRGINFPPTLKKLCLARFQLPWSEMSTIAKLPNLEVLKLLEDSFDGEIWDSTDVKFPKLKFLKFLELNIARWIITDEAYSRFPSLEQLIVENCEKLERIPLHLAEIITLKKIEVLWCKSTVADSVKQIQKEQFDSGNGAFEASVILTRAVKNINV